MFPTENFKETQGQGEMLFEWFEFSALSMLVAKLQF